MLPANNLLEIPGSSAAGVTVIQQPITDYFLKSDVIRSLILLQFIKINPTLICVI